MTSAKTWARELRVLFEFMAGFAATIFFHQPVLWLLSLAGLTTAKPYNMTPVPPLSVPSVISLAFWGGVWGLIMLPLLARIKRDGLYFLAATIFGAIFPTLVAGLVVMPLKGNPVPRTPSMIVFGLLVNGAWGLGTALLFRYLARSR